MRYPILPSDITNCAQIIPQQPRTLCTAQSDICTHLTEHPRTSPLLLPFALILISYILIFILNHALTTPTPLIRLHSSQVLSIFQNAVDFNSSRTEGAVKAEGEVEEKEKEEDPLVRRLVSSLSYPTCPPLLAVYPCPTPSCPIPPCTIHSCTILLGPLS
jgi:hypothetical protein